MICACTKTYHCNHCQTKEQVERLPILHRVKLKRFKFKLESPELNPENDEELRGLILFFVEHELTADMVHYLPGGKYAS